MNKKTRTQNTAILLINSLLVGIYSLIFYFSWFQYYHDLVYFYQKGNWLILGMYFIFCALFNFIYGGFKLGSSKTTDLIYSQVISLVFTNLLVYFQMSLVKKQFIPIEGFLLIFITEIIVAVILNYLINKLIYHIFPAKRIILFYSGEDDHVFEKIMYYQSNSFNVIKKCHISNFEMFNKNLQCNFDCLMIVNIDANLKEAIIKYCYRNTIILYEVPNVCDIVQNYASSVHLVDTPLYRLNNFGPSQLSKVVKRLIDIVFSLIVLIVSSPFWIITAIAIKCEDKGPVFYKQQRLTQYGKTFNIIKFRSMRVDAEAKGGAQFAKENDDRITKVGKIIRSLRIDEIPQMFNILKGDMSVVGPRPERPEIVADILKEVPEFDFRLKVKAGLTGYAQVYGKYNTKLKDKLLFDLMYIENYSLLLDFKIIFMTIKILFVKDSTEGYND